MSKAEKVFSVESILPLTKKVRLTKHTCFGIDKGFYKVMSRQQHVDKTRWKVYGYVTWYHFGSLGKCRIKIAAELI